MFVHVVLVYSSGTQSFAMLNPRFLFRHYFYLGVIWLQCWVWCVLYFWKEEKDGK